MYSERVTQEHCERLEGELGFPLNRIDAGRVADIVEHLNGLQKPDGTGLKRPLSREEQEFIRNERILSQVDFLYWAERYCTIQLDGAVGGGIGKLKLWETQRLLHNVVARQEEKGIDQQRRGEAADGILIVDHKDRQIGHTMYSRALCMHRLTTMPYTRAMAASIDEDKVQELYDRDKLIYDSLPFYMKPTLGFDVKGEHLYFESVNSRLLYQQGKQQSGIGQGRQFDVSHVTEVASLPYPAMLDHDFFPALPQNPYTVCILESTAQGRHNYWHEFTERVRRGASPRWVYVFVPYYAADKHKYRRTPPDDWKPSDLTMMHAKKVYETSREFVGSDVLLARDTLYWYETSRREAQDGGKLNLFLTNYAATPEESFQHTNISAFSVEVIEKIRLGTRVGTPYEIHTRV
jgi:hypothetical protein